ncbi:MAG: formate dehydrogenase subunit gamma [Acidobacteriota bacterium]
MSERETPPLEQAITEELRQNHGLAPEEAAERAARMAQPLRPRFGKWVRRELTIQRASERDERRARVHEAAAAAAVPEEEFERLSLNIRLQHVLMAVSVVVLVFTGLPLKFHENAWAKAIIDLLGGPDVSPLIHRAAATGLIVAGLWHLFYIALTREGRWNFKQLIPMPKDGLDAFQQIRYYLGLTDKRPKFDRFSYVEKFDYWAVYWGMVIMIGSGTVLWFTNFFLRYFPKWATDIAKEAHSDEALLATLAIVIWHFYNVHLNPHKFPMNRTFITGKISAREMIEEHPLEYERLMKAREQEPEPGSGGGRSTSGGGS